MSQGFDQSQFQYLMVFLKDTPSIGLDEFENQFIRSASFNPSGSGQARLYREYFGEDTKVKVLVTGEIELNEKNVFVGLKMAFPDWEFELFPMNIQKLLVKESDRLGTTEAGVVATIEPSVKMEKVEWLKPCVFDLSQKHSGVGLNSILEDKFPTQPEASKSDVPHLEEQLEKFKDIWSRDFYKSESKTLEEESPVRFDFAEENIDSSLKELFSDIDGSPEETAYSALDDKFSNVPELSDRDTDPALDAPFNEFPSYKSDPLDIHRTPDPTRDSLPVDYLSGADSEEILEQFGKKNSLWPFTETLDNEANDSSILARGISERLPFDDLDFAESRADENPFLTQEDRHSSQDFNGSKHEIEIMGVVGENPTDALRKLVDKKEMLTDQESPLKRFREKGLDIVSTIANRIKGLPTQRIGSILLVVGITSIALSFGLKFLEPDFGASRKAAGIIDINEWIIANDMLGKETTEVFETWKKTAEFQQFWNWHDNTWRSKIAIFTSVEGILSKGGIFLAIGGLLIFATTFLVKRIPADLADDESQISFGEDKRIALSFTTYNNAWPLVDTWSKEQGFKILETEGSRRLYRKAGTSSYPPTLCMITCVEDQVELEAWMTTRIPTRLIPVLSDLGINVLEAKNASLPAEIKEQINLLLIRLGHPPMA